MAALGLEHQAGSLQGAPPPVGSDLVLKGNLLVGLDHQKRRPPALGAAGEQCCLVREKLHRWAALIGPPLTALCMERRHQAFRMMTGQLVPAALPQRPPPGHLGWPVAVEPTGPDGERGRQQPLGRWWTPPPSQRPDEPPVQLLQQLKRQARRLSGPKTLPKSATGEPEPGGWSLSRNQESSRGPETIDQSVHAIESPRCLKPILEHQTTAAIASRSSGSRFRFTEDNARSL